MSFRSKTLRDLVTIGDQLQDSDLLVDVIQIFTEQAPLQIEELYAAILQGDLATVRFHAHKLKTSANVVGSENLQTICADIEALDAEDWPRIQKLALELRSEVQQECARIESEWRSFLETKQKS